MGVIVTGNSTPSKLTLLTTITVSAATHNYTVPIYSAYYVEMFDIGNCRLQINGDAGAKYTYRNLTATAVSSTAGATYVPVTGTGILSTILVSGKAPGSGASSMTGLVHCGSGAGTAGTDFSYACVGGTQLQEFNFTNLTPRAGNFIRIYGVNP